MADLVGQTLGKYQLVDRLGRGGMADVYKAYQPGLDRYVAVKVLHPHLAEEADFVNRFKREAQSVSTLAHPNIVQVFDFDIQDDSYYMVMAYVDGGRTLKEVLKELGQSNRRIAVELALDITAKVADALGYAHRKGMIHRDVKPANILIKELDHPILSDFGIAHIVDSTTLTRTGATVGTPAYMAPEQGSGGEVTERTDIYALGVTLYEMLTGRPPYEADTPYAVILKHISDPIVPPHMLVPVPQVVEPVVLKAMSKRPEYRFSTADAMATAVREALESARSGPETQIDYPDTQIASFEGYERRTDDIETNQLDEVVLRQPYGAFSQARTKTGITEEHGASRTPAQGVARKRGGSKALFAAVSLLLIALAVIGYLVFGTKKAIPPAPPGSIYAAEIAGTVQLSMPGKETIQLKTGDSVFVGIGDPRMHIDVAPDSKAVISLEDGSVLYIAPAVLGLDSLINAEQRSTGTVLTLHTGTLMAHVAPLGSNTFVVKTPVGTRADVQGSIMGLRYIDVLEQFDTDCLEGHCRQFGGPGIAPLSLEACEHSLVISIGAPEGPDQASSDQYSPLFGDAVPDCTSVTVAPDRLPDGPMPTRVPLVPTFTPQFEMTSAGDITGPSGPTSTPAPGSTATRTTVPVVGTVVSVPSLIPGVVTNLPIATLVPDVPGVVETLVPDVPDVVDTVVPDLPDLPDVPDLPIPTVKIPLLP